MEIQRMLSFVLVYVLYHVGITPCYNSFNVNFTLRNGGVMYKADTMSNKFVTPILFTISYIVTDEILESAYAEAVKDKRKVKMLVFTNPNNPTGTVYSEEEMRIVLSFCRRHHIHLVIILLLFYV